MSESEHARPRQLTMAGWFVVVGSVMLLVTVYSSIASLNSVETRDRVSEWLSTPTGKGLGLSVSDALSGLRAALMVTGLGAAASAVLGFFVLQRHRGARIALSIVVVPILLANLVTAPLTGGLLGALIAAATVILWTGPARDWFAGRPVRQPVVIERRQEPTPPAPTPAPPAIPPPADLSAQPPSAVPAATTGFGERPAQQWAPPTGLPIGYAQPVAPTAVPMAVKVACVLTWVFAGVVALLYVVLIGALAVAKSQIVDYVTGLPEWQQSNIQPDVLVPVLWIGSLLFLAWALGSMVLAVFTWRRHNWARYLLIASAAVALLAGLFALPVSLPHLAACIATIVGLLSARARAWFAQPARGSWPPQGPPYGPPPGPPYGPPPGPPQGPPAYGPPPSQSSPPPDRQGKPPVW